MTCQARMYKTLNVKFREVLIEKKTFNLVFGGFYNLLTTNYRYQGANCDGNVFDTHAKLLSTTYELFRLNSVHLFATARSYFYVCVKCMSDNRVTDIAWLPKLLNG